MIKDIQLEIKQKISNCIATLKQENEILNFKLFQKPYNKTNILLSLQFLLLKTILYTKHFWINLANKALNERNEKKRLLFVFCIGLCNFVATTPFSIIIILPLTFGTLFYILEQQHEKQVNLKKQILTTWSFLFGYFVSIFWWFFVPLTTDFLHLFWITPFAIFGLPFVMSSFIIIFFTAFLYIFHKQAQKKITTSINNTYEDKYYELKLSIAFLVSWFCGEFIRGHIIFGGFPWMMFGHMITYSFAFQIVKVIGIDIYSILFLALVLSIYYLIFNKKNIFINKISRFICYIWLCNCIIGLFIVIITPHQKINANIVASQANIPASLYDEQYQTNLNKNLQLISWATFTNKPTIMLMPESTIYKTIYSGSSWAKKISTIVPNDNSIIMSGGIFYDNLTKKIYNVNYTLNNDGYIIDIYKKQKLVPFGEYIPFRNIFPDDLINLTGMTTDFSTDGENDLFVFYKELPIIYQTSCYESIFPSYVKKNIKIAREKLLDLEQEYSQNNKIKTLKERGEIIVNLTNDSWMKWSVGPYQHFLMARFLAVSTGMPVIRVSNNGISAYIEKTGIVKTKTKLNKEDILYIKNI